MQYAQINHRRSLWNQHFLSWTLLRHTHIIWNACDSFYDTKVGGYLYKSVQKQSRNSDFYVDRNKISFYWMISTDDSSQLQWLMTPKGDNMSATTRQAMLPSVLTNCYQRGFLYFFSPLSEVSSEFTEWSRAHLLIGYARQKVNNRSQEAKRLFCIWGKWLFCIL